MQTYLEKEMAERIRQHELIRSFFDGKRAMLDARQAIFLHRYPYIGVGVAADLRKFERAVRNADETQRIAITEAFMNEKKYWHSAYVLDHCNCNIHQHIVETLDSMEKILSGMRNMHSKMVDKTEMTSNLKNDMDSDEVNEEDEQAKSFMSGNSWGRAGEDAVDYVLKWLPNSYCVIEKDCVGKYSDNIILLHNPVFSDESQEFDHIVVGPQGIFNIETKNYSGKLFIDKAGNWNRMKKGEADWIAEENPAQQLFRHHALLQSIVGNQIPIIDVICMSHPSIMINGQENSRIPVIKKDLLADYIVSYRNANLSRNTIEEVSNKINLAKTSK